MDPFGDERADLRAGIVAATVANVNRAKGKPLSPSDFMPDFGQKHDRRQSQTEIKERFMAFAHAHNARLKANG